MQQIAEHDAAPDLQPAPDAPSAPPAWPLRTTAVVALIVGSVSGLAILSVLEMLQPEPRQVLALREMAKSHAQKAKMWEYYANISEQGVTTIDRGQLSDFTMGEVLSFNHFVPRPRPKDPEEALAFDRRCIEVAVKCRMMEAYYETLRMKWERAADQHVMTVAPDPPSPLRLEPSTIQDRAD